MTHRRLASITLALLFAYPAFASGLSQEGPPPPDIEKTTVYGINVQSRPGLRQITPKDFKLFVHSDTKLPSAVSWTISQPWPLVLDKIAQENSFSVLINWNKATVTIAPDEVIEDYKVATSRMLNAATTPAPRSAPSPATQTQPPLLAASTPTPTAPASTIAVAPADQPSTSQTSAAFTAPSSAQAPTTIPVPVAYTPPVIGDADFKYVAPIAFRQTSFRSTLSAMATTFGYGLDYPLPDFRMPGALTLLGKSIEQDVALVNISLGWNHPVTLSLNPTTRKIVATLKPGATTAHIPYPLSTTPPMGYQSPNDPLLNPSYATTSTTAAAPSTTRATPQTKTPTPTASSIGAPQPTTLVLSIPAGSTLETALYALAKQSNKTLDWRVAGGFEATKTLSYQFTDWNDLSTRLLPSLGLAATTKNNTIIITPGAGS